MHLLGRMLAFDPGRRISAEEALSHEYFAALESSAVSDLGESLLQHAYTCRSLHTCRQGSIP